MDYTIDTIFYFVGTEAEYQRMRENISPKTIVFVQDSHEIYLNGWAYGKTSTNGLATTQDVNNLVDATTAINSRIDSVSASLGALQNSLDQDIQNSVQDALQDGEAIRNNAIINGLINQKIGEWSRQASLVTEGSETWSNLIQNVNGISGTVTNIMHNFDENGDVQISQATMDAGVRGSAAFTSLQSKWALVDNNEQLLRWMASGFASEANQNTSFANVYSSFKNATENGISALQTSVENIGNVYVAKSSLVSEIENNKAQIISTAGLATEVYADNAASQIFSRTVGQTGKKVSALLTQSDEDHAKLTALTTWKDNTSFVTSTAGLQTEAGLDNAVAQLLASTTSASGVGASGAMGVAISDGISTATITANQINLEGLVTANNNFKILSDGSMETIAGKIGGFAIGQDKIYTRSGGGVTLSNDGYFTLKNPDDNFTIVNMRKNGTVNFQNGKINFKVTGLNPDGTTATPETAETIIQVIDNNSQMVYGPNSVALQSLSGQIVGWMTLGEIQTQNNETTIKERATLGAGRKGYPNSDTTSLTVYNQYSNVTIVSGTNDANGDETSSNEATFGVKGTIAAKDIYIGSFHYPDHWSSIASEARYHFTNSGLTVNGLSGISGTYQFGTYYVTFTDGIATRCETTAPSA